MTISKTYCILKTNTLPTIDYITEKKEHQAIRRYLDVFTKCRGIISQAFDSKSLVGSISGVATHGETYMRWRKRPTGHPNA